MAYRIIDLLNGDNSDTENASGRLATKTSVSTNPAQSQASTSRPPLRAMQNNSRDIPPDVARLSALGKAIDTVDAARLREMVKSFLPCNAQLMKDLEERFIVKGRDVVRYHEDTDSEDREESEEEDEEGGAVGQMKRIESGEEEMMPRFTRCENCEEEFDVTANKKGDCVWHLGEKECYDDDDFWADHDPDCHGDPDDFIDDPDFAEGFMWNCCNGLGDAPGCKSTRHKAKVNIIATDPKPSTFVDIGGRLNRKRKAEEEIARPVYGGPIYAKRGY